MNTEYLQYGKSKFDFNDRSEERMAVVNKNLRRKINEDLELAKSLRHKQNASSKISL